MDGCIMFSDILTPLTAIGVEWDVVKGKGPQVTTDLSTKAGIDALTELGNIDEKVRGSIVGVKDGWSEGWLERAMFGANDG